jgi:hypothetical protein
MEESFWNTNNWPNHMNIPFESVFHSLQMRIEELSMVRAVDPNGELREFSQMIDLKRGSRR